jgi:tetratricopeptide (TPR) repeat protein
MRVELSIVRLLIEGRHFKEARGRLETLESSVYLESAFEWRILRLRVARGLQETSIHDDDLVADADKLGSPAIRCEARLAVAGLDRGPKAIPMVGEAIALAEKIGPMLEYSARHLRFDLRYEASPPDLEGAIIDLERSLAIANETSSIWQKINTEGDLAVLEAQLGNIKGAIARLRRLVGAAEARGMEGDRVLLLQNLTAFLLRDGQAREAAEIAAQVTRLAMASGDLAIGASAWSLRADALRRLGELDAALVSIDEALRIQEQRGDRMQALSLMRRAEILCGLGRTATAMLDAERSARIAQEKGERGLFSTAKLWIALQKANGGAATSNDVQKALADVVATGNVKSGFTSTVIERAEAWLQQTRIA